MRNFISERANGIPPSGIRKFFDLALTMEDVISLGVGEPDFRTPWNICESSIYSIEQGTTSYTPNKGLPALRETLSGYLKQHYNLHYNSDDEIIITSGVSEGLDIAIRSIVDPGDEISYAPCISLAGGIPVPVECTEADSFKLNPDKLQEKITRKTKALMINFPNNPTGAVMKQKDLEAIADIIIDHDLLLITDEVYAELTYEGNHIAAGSVSDLWQRTITLNGFSKAYAMTGWRVGYLCAPKDLCEAALKIHQYVMLCAPVMGQIGALEAVKSAEEDKNTMVNEYRLRRNMFVSGLNRLGLPTHTPQGAFYAFPSVKGTGLSDTEFAERLLKEQRVAVVPGSVFGAGGDYHLRCAYAVSRKKLSEALGRIETFMNGL
jgi:aminotransferase